MLARNFPKNKYGLLRGKPSVNWRRKLLLGLYIGLVVVFLLGFYLCSGHMKYPLFILIVCILSVLFALGKSNELYRLLINERAIINDLGTKDFVQTNQIKCSEVMMFSVIVFFLNYLALALSLSLIPLAFLSGATGFMKWLLIIDSVLGIAVFVYGEFIGRNTTSIKNEEPQILAIEHVAIEEREQSLKAEGKTRKHKDTIEIEKKTFNLVMIDVVWFLCVGLLIILWFLNKYCIIGQTYEIW